jgi:cytochrome c oxidase subunit 4
MSNSSKSYTYSQGVLDDTEEAHDHVLPLSLYYKVFGVLIFLTVVTVGVSYMGLGSASIYVALVVAVIKSAFVIGYFMHLKYDDRLYSLVGVLVMFFVGTFFALTFADIATRDAIDPTWGNHEYNEYKIQKSPETATCEGADQCWEKRRRDFESMTGHH